MLFNSYAFLYAFLPVTLIGYFLLGRLGRVPAIAWLVAQSFVFYGWWNPVYVPVLAGSVGGNYLLARWICASAERPRRQAWITALGVAANIGTLGYYKYLGWVASLLDMAGAHLPVPDIALPLGISFFTFTQLGYLIECRQGAVKDRGFLNYLMFVAFFPHLIAGPILQAREMLPQFADPARCRLSAENVSVGLGIFILGLLKKCLLADPVGAMVPAGFAHPEALSLFAAWHVALSYSLQLYFDFSGYSDMAVGLARMFNLRFPLNFDSPYKAASVIEYWQRWHMTLTRCLMAYLYTPIAVSVARWRLSHGLGMSRTVYATPGGFAALVLLPIFTTMGLAGLWHGAGATFVVFGLLHGCYLSVNHAWRSMRACRKRNGMPSRMARGAYVLLTYLCVLVGAVVFRAPSVPAAMSLLAGMLGWHGLGAGLPLPEGVALHLGTVGALLHAAGLIHVVRWQEAARALQAVLGLAALYGIVWGLPNTQQIFADYAPVLDRVEPAPIMWLRWRSSLPWAAVLGCATTLGLLSIGGTGEFLYFQF